MNYSICASGNLGNVVLSNLIEKSVSIDCVLTDSHSEGIITNCETHNIPVFKGNPRKGKAKEWLVGNGITIGHLLSINYLFILEEDVLNEVSGYAINFHGSLLPRYRGRTPHVWAIINGEKQTGITAHLMNSKCDDGDIVEQVIVEIGDNDTGASLLSRYNDIYPSMVEGIIAKIESNGIKTQKQDSSHATYYSKRTPEDGQIEWHWQKERIRNWCRAQAMPYPGAFAFVNGETKIIINKVEYSDLGYNDTMENGLVIGEENGKPVVKVQNGALRLEDYICESKIKTTDILK